MPLLVGGTMLYFKSLLDGLGRTAAGLIRKPRAQSIDARSQRYEGWPAAARRAGERSIRKRRPACITTDAQRIQRALEVFRRLSGQTAVVSARRGQRSSCTALPLHWRIGLLPSERSVLHAANRRTL
jgi:tRNA dimethylallyltransferase